MEFRETIKAMYSLPVSPSAGTLHRLKDYLRILPLPYFSPVLYQKPIIGYKGLMTGYQNKVIHLAGDKQKGEVKLVVNLFQSVLDGFIRGEMKKEEAEPAKV